MKSSTSWHSERFLSENSGIPLNEIKEVVTYIDVRSIICLCFVPINNALHFNKSLMPANRPRDLFRYLILSLPIAHYHSALFLEAMRLRPSRIPEKSSFMLLGTQAATTELILRKPSPRKWKLNSV